jgi:hypothetical protein
MKGYVAATGRARAGNVRELAPSSDSIARPSAVRSEAHEKSMTDCRTPFNTELVVVKFEIRRPLTPGAAHVSLDRMSNLVETLHDAIEVVLADQPDRTASTAFISQEIERRKLWTRPKDGRYPEPFQIRLRARKPEYSDRFEMPDDKTVRLIRPTIDQSQIALSVVEKAIGGKLANSRQNDHRRS